MLKYEEKLHFDKRYKQLQEATIGTQLLSLLWGIVCYVLLFSFLFWLKGKIPDFYAWASTSKGHTILGIQFHTVDTVYFLLGLLMMSYGTLRLAEITRENHKANDKTNSKPIHLLTNGYYADVRHPMYGTFIFMFTSLAFSVHSALGLVSVILIIAAQYINAHLEETRTLLPLFKGNYLQYKKKTPAMLLTKWQIILLSSLIIITLAGFIKFI
ncbi:MAG: methyltransferase [bacterium]|nr:methyltransferase [bacterium]